MNLILTLRSITATWTVAEIGIACVPDQKVISCVRVKALNDPISIFQLGSPLSSELEGEGVLLSAYGAYGHCRSLRCPVP